MAEGSAIQLRIYDDMKARAAYYKNSQKASVRLQGGSPRGAAAAAALGDGELEVFYASRRSDFEKQVLSGRHTILRNRVANFMFDYNTAEAVLLASALLINLGGICFDSSRFTPAMMARPGIQDEYNSLAFAIIAIMFLSIIYWFSAMGMDILLVTAPETVQACLSSIGRAGKDALSRAKKAASGKGAAGGASPGGSSKRLRVIGGVTEEAAADPNSVSMQTNALMVADLAKGSGGGGAPKDLSKLGDAPPDAITWPGIKAAVAAADRRAKDLAMEVERLKEQLDSGGGSGSGASPRTGAAARKAFDPTAASGVKTSAAAKLKARRSSGGGGGKDDI